MAVTVWWCWTELQVQPAAASGSYCLADPRLTLPAVMDRDDKYMNVRV